MLFEHFQSLLPSCIIALFSLILGYSDRGERQLSVFCLAVWKTRLLAAGWQRGKSPHSVPARGSRSWHSAIFRQNWMNRCFPGCVPENNSGCDSSCRSWSALQKGTLGAPLLGSSCRRDETLIQGVKCRKRWKEMIQALLPGYSIISYSLNSMREQGKQCRTDSLSRGTGTGLFSK